MGSGWAFVQVREDGRLDRVVALEMYREGRRGDKDGSEPLAAELNGGFTPALIAVFFP